MYFYAQLNENNICIGVSQLSGEVEASHMILLDSFDQDKLWRKYENGDWSAEKYEPQSTAPLTEFEETQQRVTDLEIAISYMLGGVV